MRRSWVRAGGLRLRVGRSGDGPPLLLITGIGLERLSGALTP